MRTIQLIFISLECVLVSCEQWAWTRVCLCLSFVYKRMRVLASCAVLRCPCSSPRAIRSRSFAVYSMKRMPCVSCWRDCLRLKGKSCARKPFMNLSVCVLLFVFVDASSANRQLTVDTGHEYGLSVSFFFFSSFFFLQLFLMCCVVCCNKIQSHCTCVHEKLR